MNSKVVPLPKSTEDVKLSDSYRSVSILRPAVKILEIFIYVTLTKNLPNADNQHGCHSFHKLFISNGFNQKRPPERTILATLDLSNAFDMVCHRTLVKTIEVTTVPDSLAKWIAIYMSGRQAKTQLRGALFSSRIVRTGVAQGSVFSPTLFIFFKQDAANSPPEVNFQAYADDFHPFVQSLDIKHASEILSNYLNTLND